MSLWGGGRTPDPNIVIMKLPVENTESNRGMLRSHKAKNLEREKCHSKAYLEPSPVIEKEA